MPKRIPERKPIDTTISKKPCDDYTDRDHPFMKGVVVNLSPEPVTGITSDFHDSNWSRFTIPGGKSTLVDLCIDDTDALYFQRGIMLWQNYGLHTRLVDHTNSSSIVKIPDENFVTIFSYLGQLHVIFSACFLGACPYIMTETQRLEAGLRDMHRISSVNPLEDGG